MNPKKHVLPIIVFAQFCCTSLWFAGNSIMGDLISVYTLPTTSLGHLTSAVQLGFIIGTLVFAVLTITDLYSPSRVFLISAILASVFNLAIILDINSFGSLLVLRGLTGFFLAGIYPVGMKIAADYFDKGLGRSLGYLVGALVVGTAFPHLIKSYSLDLNWQFVIITTSIIAIIGGLLIYTLVPDGPFRKVSNKLDLGAITTVFRSPKMKTAAFGYFGHMWELYAFWAFVPVILMQFEELNPEVVLNVPLWSFAIIGGGGIACVIGGYLSTVIGTKRTATIALALSCLCCLLSPLVLMINSEVFLLSFLLFWGAMVVADSPLFSTLVAQNTEAEIKGTALTLVNSIGFAITIVSIQLLSLLQGSINHHYIYTLLAIGPLIGLFALVKKKPRLANVHV